MAMTDEWRRLIDQSLASDTPPQLSDLLSQCLIPRVDLRAPVALPLRVSRPGRPLPEVGPRDDDATSVRFWFRRVAVVSPDVAEGELVLVTAEMRVEVERRIRDRLLRRPPFYRVDEQEG